MKPFEYDEFRADVARLRYLASIRECDELPASAFWRVPRRAPDLIRLDRIE